MKILIVTPLFPPDTAPAAVYTKELASHLAQHEVHILLYGNLPEAVPNCSVTTVSKKASSIVRLIHMTRALLKEAKNADVLLVQNGASVELPVFLFTLLAKKPIIFMESDGPALERTYKSILSSWVLSKLHQRATVFSRTTEYPWPTPKPIIHPLLPYPEMQTYSHSWKAHLEKVETLMKAAV